MADRHGGRQAGRPSTHGPPRDRRADAQGVGVVVGAGAADAVQGGAGEGVLGDVAERDEIGAAGEGGGDGGGRLVGGEEAQAGVALVEAHLGAGGGDAGEARVEFVEDGAAVGDAAFHVAWAERAPCRRAPGRGAWRGRAVPGRPWGGPSSPRHRVAR